MVEADLKQVDPTGLETLELFSDAHYFNRWMYEEIAPFCKGPILEIGNTNSRYKFPVGARQFVENWNAQGPAHHCAIGKGHIAAKIIKLGNLLNIQTIQVC